MARRCDDTVDKKRVNSCVIKHLFLEGVEQPKISPKNPGNALSDALLMSRFQNFVADDDLTCKRGSVGQSEGLSIPRSSVGFRLKPDTSNSHEFELHRPSNKGTNLLLKVIKAIIIITAKKKPSSARFLKPRFAYFNQFINSN